RRGKNEIARSSESFQATAYGKAKEGRRPPKKIVIVGVRKQELKNINAIDQTFSLASPEWPRQARCTLGVGSANHGHFVTARTQRLRKRVGAMAGGASGGAKMLMKI